MSSRAIAIGVGILMLLATATHILSSGMIDSVLTTHDYLSQVYTNRVQITVGVLLEYVDAIAGYGIGMLLYPIVRRHNEIVAISYAGTRLFESALLAVFKVANDIASYLYIPGAWAAGIADERDGSEMTAATPFLSASVGKLFTAATVLSLAEEGVLSLDDTIVDWLPPDVYTGIPVKGGDYAYGLWRIRPASLFLLLRGYPDLYGVSGSTGTFLYYVPEYDAVIAGAFNQTNYAEGHVRFLIQVLALLGRVTSRG